MILDKPLLMIQLFSVYCITSERYFYLAFMVYILLQNVFLLQLLLKGGNSEHYCSNRKDMDSSESQIRKEYINMQR